MKRPRLALLFVIDIATTVNAVLAGFCFAHADWLLGSIFALCSALLVAVRSIE